MKELTTVQCSQISGGRATGVLVGSLAAGFLVGGPFGMGIALGGTLMKVGHSKWNKKHKK
jgi:hypothetical protein